LLDHPKIRLLMSFRGSAMAWPTVAYLVFCFSALSTAWWHGEVLAFRDSLHFYFPLWWYFDCQPSLDKLLPTWNPADGFGCSIVGEPTSMVFYPPRLILHLGFGSLEQRAGLFWLFHLIVMYGNWYLAARRFGWNPLLSQWTAWGYCLSGPVFFQIYNPPYLIGATWLPLAMLGLVQLHRSTLESSLTARWIATLSIALSLMVIGGDAQLAYHLVLLGGLFWLGTFIQSKSFSHAARSLTALVASVLLAIGISAVQSLPTMHWLSESNRIVNSALAPERIGQFEYSLRWWYAATWFFSDAFGSFTPYHTRWSLAFSQNERVWIPSLHVGLPLVLTSLALITTRAPNLLRGPQIRSLLSRIRRCDITTLGMIVLVVAMASSFEWGLGRIWSIGLPGYHYFRYPAKWSVPLTWSVCLLAGQLLQPLVNDPSKLSKSFRRTLRRWLVFVAFVGVGALLVNFAAVAFPPFTKSIHAWLSRVPEDAWCGPIDVPKTVRDWGRSGLKWLLIAGVMAWALRRFVKTKQLQLFWQLLVFATIVELSFSAWSQLVFVDSESLRANVLAASQDLPMCQFGDLKFAVAPWTIPTDEVQKQAPSAERQAKFLLGKLHLLAAEPNSVAPKLTLRNLHADFSLRPNSLDQVEHDYDFSLKLAEGTSITEAKLAGPEVKFRINSKSRSSFEIPVQDSQGWVIVSDAQACRKETSDRGLIKLMTAPGEHWVALKFWPPGLTLGLFLSSLSLTVLLTLFVRTSRAIETGQ
jgi:hypothetical protein